MDLTERKYAQLPANRIVLEGDEEEQSINQHPPDSNIRANSYGKGIRPNHDSPIGEHYHEGETQRASHHGIMDEMGRLDVSEVERGQIEEVQNEDDFGEQETAMHP